MAKKNNKRDWQDDIDDALSNIEDQKKGRLGGRVEKRQNTTDIDDDLEGIWDFDEDDDF